MAEELYVDPSGAGREQGTDDGAGQPDKGTGEGGGEPKAAQDKSGEQDAGTGLLFDGMTGEQLHKSYKELQRQFGKNSEEMKSIRQGLDRMGGIDQVGKWFDYLSNNPRFAEFIKAEQTRNQFGINMDELDDDGRKALSLVEKVAETIADRKIQSILNERVNPIYEDVREQAIAEHFAVMDDKYPDWREYQGDMAELSEELSPSRQAKPSFEDIEDLYWKAIRKTGKMDAVAARMHEKKLAEKKGKSTERPATSVSKGQPSKPKSIEEAFRLAKEASQA